MTESKQPKVTNPQEQLPKRLRAVDARQAAAAARAKQQTRRGRK
jgi:hypothetical protein